MMNIVGNQIIHEAADHYGWKEGSTEKLLLHGAIGALTGTMSGGNALSGAVSGSVNEFALAYIEKTKGRDWMDTHPDTVQAISTALGAVAGSLTGDRNTGAYISQMGTKWKLQLIDFSNKEGDIINSIVGWRGHFTAMGKLWKSIPQDLWQNLIAVFLPGFL